MSYHIYTTEGIVLKRNNFGEANILLHILTKDLGLIMASARSARLGDSKLGSSLQEYSYITVSAIHGKNGWKVTSVSYNKNFYFDSEDQKRKVIAQISSVLMKMIQGESPHPEIFQIVSSGFEYLKSVSDENISNFEVLMMIRILYSLGYVAKDSVTEEFLKDLNWNDELLNLTNDKKIILVGLINKALKESHL